MKSALQSPILVVFVVVLFYSLVYFLILTIL